MSGTHTPKVIWPSDFEQRWVRLRQLQARASERADRALQRAHGVSLSEYLALGALAYSDDHGHLRQQVLADTIGLNQSSVTRLVSRLERRGLSERYLCEEDRRGVYTQITDEGRGLVTTARTTYLQAIEDVLEELGQGQDLADLVHQLQKS